MDFEHILDDLYLQLNQIRFHPKETAAKLSTLKRQFQGNIFRNQYRTREGTQALDNLIQDLQKRSPIQKRLKWSFALHMVADEQASLLGQKGIYTTQGTNYHRTLPERISDFAIVKGRLSEVYEFGGRTPNQILQQLLIDDGLVSRKRRSTLIDPIYNYIGIGASYHQKNEACTVIILAEDIVGLVAPDVAGYYKRRRGVPIGKQSNIKVNERVILNEVIEKTVITQNNGQSPFSQLISQGNENKNVNALGQTSFGGGQNVTYIKNENQNNNTQNLFILEENKEQRQVKEKIGESIKLPLSAEEQYKFYKEEHAQANQRQREREKQREKYTEGEEEKRRKKEEGKGKEEKGKKEQSSCQIM